MWSKCIGGSNDDGNYGGEEKTIDFELTNDGGLIIAAKTYSSDGDAVSRATLIPGHTVWIMKLSNTGTIQWSNFYGGSSLYGEAPHKITKTNDGGYIIACETLSSDLNNYHGFAGNSDFWILKIDSVGNMQWNNCFGGDIDDIPYDIIQTSDSNYIAVGTTRSTNGNVTGNHGSYDGWIIKISNSGTLIWQKTLGGSRDEKLNSVLETNDGGYIILGTTDTYNNGDVSGNHADCSGCTDIWLVKTNSTGAKTWQVCYGQASEDYATQLIDNNNNTYTLFGNVGGPSPGLWTAHMGGDYFAIKLGYPNFLVENSLITQNIIYPNPATKTIYITSDHMKYYQLFDINGKSINSSTNNFIDISNLNKGIYFINIYDSNNTLIRQDKFSKE